MRQILREVENKMLDVEARPTRKGWAYICPYCGQRKYLYNVYDFPVVGNCAGKIFFIKEVK
jgi:hypothetical protein